MMKLSQKEEEEEEEKAINMDKYINEKRFLYLTNLERLSYQI